MVSIFFLYSNWEGSNTLDLHTDASGALGFGEVFGKKWFQGAWAQHKILDHPGIRIAWQELFAIVAARMSNMG